MEPVTDVRLTVARDMQFVNIPAENCLVVEDAVSGVEAAHAAGMKAASIGDAAEKGEGDFVLKSFSQLLEIM